MSRRPDCSSSWKTCAARLGGDQLFTLRRTYVNPASASPDPQPAMGLSWGIKRSFIDYITSLPDGAVSATDGATVSDCSLFSFSHGASDYDVARGAGVLRFRGDVRLA
ncbi:HtaA domain-containing protein [Pseudarthrobacter sp. So.54]